MEKRVAVTLLGSTPGASADKDFATVYSKRTKPTNYISY